TSKPRARFRTERISRTLTQFLSCDNLRNLRYFFHRRGREIRTPNEAVVLAPAGKIKTVQVRQMLGRTKHKNRLAAGEQVLQSLAAAGAPLADDGDAAIGVHGQFVHSVDDDLGMRKLPDGRADLTHRPLPVPVVGRQK